MSIIFNNGIIITVTYNMKKKVHYLILIYDTKENFSILCLVEREKKLWKKV